MRDIVTEFIIKLNPEEITHVTKQYNSILTIDMIYFVKITNAIFLTSCKRSGRPQLDNQ